MWITQQLDFSYTNQIGIQIELYNQIEVAYVGIHFLGRKAGKGLYELGQSLLE